jgi:phage I-like protein
VTRFPAAAALVAALAALPAAAQQPARPSLSGPEMLDRADKDVASMRQVLKQVLQRLEESRAEKDIVKLNCVNEKLTQIKGLLKVAEQADISLQEAVARRDEGAEADFAKVGMAKGKVDQLRAEAEACVGQLAYIVDERTLVEVEVPGNLPKGDPTDREPPPPPVVRPPPASRYQ